MGRKSRKKKERRVDPMWRAFKTEWRARRVEPTLPAWECVLANGGSIRIRECLISRNNQRWDNLVDSSAFLASAACHSVSLAVQLDWIMVHLGYRLDQHPSMGGEDWPTEIIWGLDSCSAYARLAMVGGFVGAAALARSQLERWTMNAAFNQGITKEGKDMASYMHAVWSPFGVDPYPGWALLSEVVHGRGWGSEAVAWEAVALMEDPLERCNALALTTLASKSLEVALGQVRNCVYTLARELHGKSEHDFPPPDAWVGAALDRSIKDRMVGLYQLDLHITAQPATQELDKAVREYEDVLASIETWPPQDREGLTALAFLARRGRAVRASLDTFALEREELGEQFEELGLASKDTLKILVSEMAGILGKWLSGEGPQALTVASSALRSCFMLWLEDDPRAMICLRTVLENTARARTWRLKPKKAQRLVHREPHPTSRDWIEAAGWRRLSVLLTSLGEFSHVAERTTHALRPAWLKLASLQQDPPGDPMRTARNDAMENVTWLLAIETFKWLQGVSPALAEAFHVELGARPLAELEKVAEGYLNHAFSQRA